MTPVWCPDCGGLGHKKYGMCSTCKGLRLILVEDAKQH